MKDDDSSAAIKLATTAVYRHESRYTCRVILLDSEDERIDELTFKDRNPIISCSRVWDWLKQHNPLIALRSFSDYQKQVLPSDPGVTMRTEEQIDALRRSLERLLTKQASLCAGVVESGTGFPPSLSPAQQASAAIHGILNAERTAQWLKDER